MFSFGKKKQVNNDIQGNIHDPNMPITGEMLTDLLSGSKTSAGSSVSPDNAMACGAVFAAVRLLSSTVSTLPIKVYQQESDDIRVGAKDHQYAHLIRYKPNNNLNSIDWRDMMMHFICLRGDGFNVMRYNGHGVFTQIMPVHSDAMTVERKAGRLVYRVRLSNGGFEEYSREEVLHFSGAGFNGLRSMSPLKAYKEAVGIARAAEEHSGLFFQNGTNLGGLLVKKGTPLSKESKELVEDAWKKYKGNKNAHATGILPAEFDYLRLGMSAEDAQLLTTRQFQVTEIARIFQIPPHMIGDLERATFSNIEHQNINFVQYSLAHHLARMEMEINEKLFGFGDYFCEFQVKGLLRGDMKTQIEYYSKGIASGHLTSNETRKLENLPPKEGGDVLRFPMNAQTSDQENEDAK